jgi:hypothetical protein
MAGGRLIVPNADPIYTANGTPAVGTTMAVNLTGTTTPATMYSDATLNTAITNPQVADSAGLFYDETTSIYLDTAANYDVQLELPNGQVFSYTNIAVQPVQVSLSGYAPINSPAFTGTPTAPTPAANDTSSKLATTQFVVTALSGSTTFNASVIPATVTGAVGLNTSASTQNSSWNIASAVLPSATVGQNPQIVSAFSGTLYLTGSLGLNGLDAGSLLASTFYWVWLITNGTTSGLLASTSSTNPTMPSGYGFKALVGVIRTDSSKNTMPFMFSNGNFDYLVTPNTQIATGSTGSTWTQISVASWVPTGAVRVRGSMHVNNNTINAGAAPINMGSVSASNGALQWILGGSNGGGDYSNYPYDFPLVTQSVWWWSNGSQNALYVTGFSIGKLGG